MIIPNIGKFTNGNYNIIGVMWFGRLIGICTYSNYNHIIKKGKLVDLPQYHLKTDIKPQFYKIQSNGLASKNIK